MSQENKKKLYKNKYLSFNNKVFIKTIKRKLKKRINPFKRITKFLKRKRRTKLFFFRHIHIIKKVKRFQKRKAFKAYFFKLKENNNILVANSSKTRPISFTTYKDGKPLKRFTLQKRRKKKWSFVRFYRYGQKLKAYRKIKQKRIIKNNFFNILKAKHNLLTKYKKGSSYVQLLPTPEKILTNKVTLYKPYKFRRFFKSSLHTYAYQFLAKQLLNKVYGGINEKLLTEVARSKNTKINKNKLIISTLERRLDVLIFRMGLTQSIFESQQLISHGFVTVNNKVISVRDYFVEPQDLIQVNYTKPAFDQSILRSKIKNFIENNQKNISFFYKELNRINKLSALQRRKYNILPIIRLANNKLKLKALPKKVISFRKIKDLLFLIKTRIKQKIKFSYIKLLSYLWTIYRPIYSLNNERTNKIIFKNFKNKKRIFRKNKVNIKKLNKFRLISKFVSQILTVKNNRLGVMSLRSFMKDWNKFNKINVKRNSLKYIKPLNLKLKNYKYPKYLQINFKTKSAILLSYPKLEQIPLSFKVQNKLKFINQYLKIA